MKKSRLHISKNFSLPIDLVTSTQAILARKRSGKSYLAQVETEEMLEQGAQVGVFDPTGAWWGLKSSADGKSAGYSIVIFGGRNADAPLDFRAGKAMATAFLDRGFSAVFDISLFTLPQQLQFVMEFCDEILRVNRNALHLVIDEADTFAPQTPRSKPAGECLGTVSRLVSQGGLGGTGVTMITQRSAKINWDVLSQIDILTVLRMGAPLDIKPVVSWLQTNTTPEFAAEVGAALPSLPVGTAFIASAHLEIANRVEVRQKRTFNSGATPKPGERKIVPKVFAEVDAKKLGEQIAGSIAAAKANSPDELKARIRELERQVARPAAAPVIVQKPAPESQIDKENLRMLVKKLDALSQAVNEATELAQADEDRRTRAVALLAELQKLLTPPSSLSKVLKKAGETKDVAQALVPAQVREREQSAPTPKPVRAPAPVQAGDRSLDGPESRVLDNIAWLVDSGVEDPESELVAFLSGYSTSTSTSFKNPRSRLKERGMIIYPTPGRLRLTDEGRAAANRGNAPMTIEHLHAAIFAQLPGPEEKMLRLLLASYPESITSELLAEKTGYSTPTSTSFKNPRSRLKSLGFAEYPTSGVVRATELLFPAALR
jgi:hypothetical protein